MPPRCGQINAFQHLKIAIRLVKIADLYHRRNVGLGLQFVQSLSQSGLGGCQFVRIFCPIATAHPAILRSAVIKVINFDAQFGQVALG